MPKVVHDVEIFQAVMQVIIARGYARATTKQMAKAAGVSEVTLFRKFESKAQMVKLAISAIADQMQFETVTQCSWDVNADLMRVAMRYQELAVQYGQFIAFLLPEMSRYPELIAALEDRPLGFMRDISQMIARYQSEGILRDEHPLQAAAALLGPIIYTNMMRGAISENLIPLTDLKKHIDFFLNGRLSG